MLQPPQNLSELGQRLGMAVDELITFSVKAPRLYSRVEIPREGKTPRIIEPPHAGLKEIQRKLLTEVLIHLRCDDALFARQGTNTIDAVIPHISKPLLLAMDIQSFFPNVKPAHIYSALRNRGIPDDVARTIVRLTTHGNHMPQGAPTSVALGRLVLHPVVLEVKRALDSTGTPYDISVYVDDVMISGAVGLKRMVGTISKIFERHGFTLDKGKKLKVLRLMDGEQEALGIRLDRGGIEPGKKLLQKISDTTHADVASKRVRQGLLAYVAYLKKREQKYRQSKATAIVS